MSEEEVLEWMELYREGKLSDTEKYKFEDRLRQDIEFTNSYNDFVINHSAIAIQSRKELKGFLTELEKGQPAIASKPKQNWLFWSLAAAACLSLITISFLWYFTSSARLFDKYYTPYPNVVAAIERNATQADPWKQAFQVYEQEDYAAALFRFQLLLKDHPEDPALNLYAGLCELELSHMLQAKEYFNKVIANSPNDFIHQAYWYKALVQVKEGNKKEAKATLAILAQFDGTYQEKALSLLNEL